MECSTELHLARCAFPMNVRCPDDDIMARRRPTSRWNACRGTSSLRATMANLTRRAVCVALPATIRSNLGHHWQAPQAFLCLSRRAMLRRTHRDRPLSSRGLRPHPTESGTALSWGFVVLTCQRLDDFLASGCNPEGINQRFWTGGRMSDAPVRVHATTHWGRWEPPADHPLYVRLLSIARKMLVCAHSLPDRGSNHSSPSSSSSAKSSSSWSSSTRCVSVGCNAAVAKHAMGVATHGSSSSGGISPAHRTQPNPLRGQNCSVPSRRQYQPHYQDSLL